MGVLGKDYLDYRRPLTHTKIQFGADQYWIEEKQKGGPYGETLVDILNYDASHYQEYIDRLQSAMERKCDEEVLNFLSAVASEFLKLPFYRVYLKELGQLELYLMFPDMVSDLYTDSRLLQFLFEAAEDISLIQERYVWFLTNALQEETEHRKRGQRKTPLADRIVKNYMEAFVSGKSLGSDRHVDAPNVQVQYAVVETKEGGAEIVEKIYFDRLSDFVYVELLKGLQKGFLPKRCPNCGKWFLQEPGTDFTYCGNPSPQDPEKLCRDIGSINNFRNKAKNNEIWSIHQRAYRKYYARMMKKKMTRAEFFEWAETAAELRDEALKMYETAGVEERKKLAEGYKGTVNKR